VSAQYILFPALLSDDYSKLAILRTDRTIEFHAKFGHYYKLRVPKHGRDLMYDSSNCDLLIAGEGSDIYRINLERGTFLKPLTSSCDGINVCGINPQFGLHFYGGADGVAEFWDPRIRKPIAFIDVSEDTTKKTEGFVSNRVEVTAGRYSDDGLIIALGNSTGQVLLYDLRTANPILMKDHQYGFPIIDIKFHNYTKTMLSACKKILKIWNTDSESSNFTYIEPKNDIRDVCSNKDNGLIFIATDHTKICSYYIPDMGPAPEWSSWLDNLTEEIEVKDNKTIYQDYQFLTKDELSKLGVEKLIGSPYLRAYLHGYFMDIRLYKKFRAIVNPDEYKNYLKEKIEKKMEKRRQGRLKVTTSLPKYNSTFAMHLNDSSNNKVKKIMEDGRFENLFEDEDFNIDMDSDAWLMRHSIPRKKKK